MALSKTDPAVAQALVEQFLPDEEERVAFVEIVAAVIEQAHAKNPQNWSATLGKAMFRVNQGKVLLIDLIGLREASFFIANGALPKQWHDARPPYVESEEEFDAIPHSKRWKLSVGALVAEREFLLPAILESVGVAAQSTSTAIWARHHSPALVQYLSAEVGRPLPQPKYPPTPALLEFRPVFAQFLETYWSSVEGRVHRETYERMRAVGRSNWEAIKADRQRGQDVTDAVLDKLLPHANTQANRARGAWIHIAPAITKDVRTWFENGGWVRKEDWPRVAAAIVEFIERVETAPDALAAACHWFSERPESKGLQSGFLSPILNTLDPGRFLLVNSKSLRMLRAFSGRRYSPKLDDYTRNIAELRKFLEKVSPVIVQAGVTERPADVLDQFAHWLVAEYEPEDNDESVDPAEGILSEAHAFWKVAPGRDAGMWKQCREQGFIAVGWPDLGDLAAIDQADFDRRATALGNKYSPFSMSLVWQFSRIRPGSVIVANQGTRVAVGVGRTTGPYVFVAGASYPHRLPVEWFDTTPRAINEAGWRGTFAKIDRARVERILSSPHLSGGDPIEGGEVGEDDEEDDDIPPPKVLNPSYPVSSLASDTHLPENELKGWIASVRRKGQAILAGPPGTGKTWIARHLARHLVAEGDGVVEIVQFHPAYAYEDFVQGLRPVAGDAGIRFELVPGRLLSFLKDASKRTGTSVLIVDEINRANLSRVFGEFMHAIEYRDEPLALAGGGTLTVPKRVVILGTMNTSDRSIALVDHALRRRFAYLRLGPRYDVLVAWLNGRGFPSEGLVSVLKRMNAALQDPNYEVGISFFLRDDLLAHLEAIWNEEVFPYVEEHFFDQPGRAAAFRWEMVRDELQG